MSANPISDLLAAPKGRVGILGEDPDLAADLAADRREEAERRLVGQELVIPRGGWRIVNGDRPADGAGSPDGIGLLVLDGLLIRSVGLDSRNGSELLGQGDLLRPWQDDEEAPTLPTTAGWRVLAPLRVARLDLEFTRAVADYPEVLGRLFGRAIQRSRHLAINMAIVHNPRIDVRLHMLLWHLAGRWGRVVRGGISVNLPLTHSLLSELIASRRPTVTTALGDLGRQGLVETRDGGWLLTGPPPHELYGEAALRGVVTESFLSGASPSLPS